MTTEKSTQKTAEPLLKKQPLGISRLNRKAVIGLSGVLVVLIGWIMISALSSPAPTETHDDGAIPRVSGVGQTQPNGLSSLPAGYEDSTAINAVLAKGRQTTIEIPASVNQELSTLKAQQASLKLTLAELRDSPTPPPVEPPSPMDQEAMNSSIFFAGGAPPQLPTGNTTQTQTSQKDKSNGSPDKSSSDNAYDSQNMQKQKLSFLNSKPDTSIYDTHAMQFPASPYIIQAGTVIPAVLQTQINSNLPGNLVALVRSDVYDSINGQYLLIPKGSRLIGQYSSQLSYGQDQIQVKFERLIRPDGSSIVLPNPQGTNNQGVSGLSDEVNNHWGQVIGSSILAAVFNIPAIVATNQQNTNQTCTRDDTTGQVFCQPSVSTVLTTSALQSAGQTVSQVGGQLTQRSLNLQPTVIIHAGYTFSVMVMKDMIIPPFHSATS